MPAPRACHAHAYTRGLHSPDNRRAAESAAGCFLILSLLLRREQKEKEVHGGQKGELKAKKNQKKWRAKIIKKRQIQVEGEPLLSPQ